jgi:hypothetical protein
MFRPPRILAQIARDVSRVLRDIVEGLWMPPKSVWGVETLDWEQDPSARIGEEDYSAGPR